MKKFSFRAYGVDCTFYVNGKYSMIVGDSGTGKSELASFCLDVSNDRSARRNLDFDMYALTETSASTAYLISQVRDCLFVIDEEQVGRGGHDLCSRIIESPNYFIFCTRAGLGTIPYGVRDLFTLKSSSSRFEMVPVYPKLERGVIRPTCAVVIEDRGSGFAYTEPELKRRGFNTIVSAEGKSKIANTVHALSAQFDKIATVVDLCGCGFEYMSWLESRLLDAMFIADSESFEYELYRAITGRTALFTDVVNPTIYRSAEDYYLLLVKKLFEDAGFYYSKSECPYFSLPFRERSAKLYPSLQMPRQSNDCQRSSTAFKRLSL